MVFQKKGAEVVTGMRGREANPDLSTVEGKQNALPSYMRAPSSAGKDRVKPVRFMSRYAGHILSLVRDVDGPIDPATGRATSTKPIQARFKDYQFSLDLDPSSYNYKQNQQLYNILTSHPRFGIGKDFWLVEDAKKLAEEARYQDMKSQVQADPELLNRLRGELGALKGDEFPLPEATPAS